MSKALYRKYRSRSLDEIVGQPHITTILKQAIARDVVAHAYLLTGPRGVGKTSIARILAHEINGLPYTDESTHLDIIEIDAASNNSVEDIRDLREKVQIAPVSAPKKVYIIDEVHMLSKSAFNALLKTLEEPPEHVVFILATTDADKLPATILSRVQRFNFRAINPRDAVQHLMMIAEREHIQITPEAVALIARHGEGSFRDSISLLDQARSLSDQIIDHGMVAGMLGLADEAILSELLDAHHTGNIAHIVRLIDQAEQAGVPADIVADQLVQLIRQRVIAQPSLVPLLDELLDVRHATWPQVKLLTVLSRPRATASPQSSAILSDTHVIQEAVADHVASPAAVPYHVSSSATQPTNSTLTSSSVKSGTTQAESKQREDTTAPVSPRASKSMDQLTDQPTATMTQAREKNTKDTALSCEFPWRSFIEALDGKISAYTMLIRADYTFDGATLQIFAGRKFAKTQLDKSLPILAQTAQSLGFNDLDIVILPSTKPPQDSQKAAILAMMGGGEEITINAE